ncbi:MAG: ribonuclease Y [Bdellovibrionales bacterium]|nr:ribonuclease Y [Bdellovibrionales bacterium]
MSAGVLVALLVSLIFGIALGLVVLFAYNRLQGNKKKGEAEKEVERILHRAKSQAAKIDRDSKNKAKDFESRARRNVESDIRKQKQKLQNTESQLKEKQARLEKEYAEKEEKLKHEFEEISERNERVKIAESRIVDLEKKATEKIKELELKIENIAGLSAEQAKSELLETLKGEAEQEANAELIKIEKQLEADSQSKARKILSVAISRYASEVSTERTITAIPLSGEEMKGKIIGRDGRNIRALEAACGVDVVIDETPDSVIISSFDPVRREVGKRAIEKLMEDGRVHPARIEEVVDKVKSDIIKNMKEEGEKACFDLGVHGVHPELLSILGGLRFRHTGTQNLLSHSVEVAYLAGLMAAEIGADVKLARRAGLLHDIGRGIDHSIEGDHCLAGAEFAKKYGEAESVIKAIRGHEGTSEDKTLLVQLIQAANNLSKDRPGARRSQMENYIRRLEDLESIGNSFDGVERTFAIQSGKEIRVIVDSANVTDDQAQMLSRDIVRKIERELNYPGQIKVAVVRETRIVEHAR